MGQLPRRMEIHLQTILGVKSMDVVGCDLCGLHESLRCCSVFVSCSFPLATRAEFPCAFPSI